jgi:hypothetical protein
VSLRAIDLCLTLFNIAIPPELFASAGFFLLIHGYAFINLINHQVSKWFLFLASSFGHAKEEDSIKNFCYFFLLREINKCLLAQDPGTLFIFKS